MPDTGVTLGAFRWFVHVASIVAQTPVVSLPVRRHLHGIRRTRTAAVVRRNARYKRYPESLHAALHVAQLRSEQVPLKLVLILDRGIRVGRLGCAGRCFDFKFADYVTKSR